MPPATPIYLAPQPSGHNIADISQHSKGKDKAVGPTSSGPSWRIRVHLTEQSPIIEADGTFQWEFDQFCQTYC